MTTFTESDERQALRRAVADLGRKYGHDYFEKAAKEGRKTTELWQEAGKLGYLGVAVPEEFGGGGGDNLHGGAGRDELYGQEDGDVLLASHDGDFLPQVDALLTGDRLVGLLAFREFVNSQYASFYERGLKVFDLEDDVRAFNVVLPRVRIIDLAEFDPAHFLR